MQQFHAMAYAATVLAGTFGLQQSVATTWNFDLASTGDDIFWTSDTSIPANSSSYDYEYHITTVEVKVEYLGIELGPFDVTGQIDPATLNVVGSEAGPLPIVIRDGFIDGDPDGDGVPDIYVDLYVALDSNGYGKADFTNLLLDSFDYDLGWPLGVQTVDLTYVRLIGSMTARPIGGPICAADVNDDGEVGVDDLLQVISEWGDTGDVPGDIDGNGEVGVNDLLELLAAWGPC